MPPSLIILSCLHHGSRPAVGHARTTCKLYKRLYSNESRARTSRARSSTPRNATAHQKLVTTDTQTRQFFGVSFPSFNHVSGHKGRESAQMYHERKILPYSRKQLYNVVTDVDSYHTFLPYCSSSRVISSCEISRPNAITGDRDLPTAVKKDAELTVGFLVFKERYVSEVTCIPFESVEAVASSSSPLFKRLVTTWRFQPADPASPHLAASAPTGNSTFQSTTSNDSAQDAPIPIHSGKADAGCDTPGPTLLSIDLSYEFSNPAHAGVAASFFSIVSKMMVNAFEERLLRVYGAGTK